LHDVLPIWLGIDAHVEHGKFQDAQDEELTAIQVVHLAHIFVGDFTVGHTLEHPQRIRSAQDEGRGRQKPDPEVVLHRCHDHHEFAHEATRGRQPGVGHGEQHEEGHETRHDVHHTAVVGDLAAVQAIVEHPDTQEHGARYKTVRDHLHDAAFQAAGIEDEEAQRHKTHVRDG